MISVLIADDQDLIRKGLRMLLEAEPDLRVTGEAGDGSQALAQARCLDPDVILMDVRMPGLDGIQATTQLAQALLRLDAAGPAWHLIEDMSLGGPKREGGAGAARPAGRAERARDGDDQASQGKQDGPPGGVHRDH